jgi:hypothetical protein
MRYIAQSDKRRLANALAIRLSDTLITLINLKLLTQSDCSVSKAQRTQWKDELDQLENVLFLCRALMDELLDARRL